MTEGRGHQAMTNCSESGLFMTTSSVPARLITTRGESGHDKLHERQTDKMGDEVFCTG